jgi:dolichol kinase
MDLSGEIKRKIFHNLSLVYLLMYWVLPPVVTIWILGLVIVVETGVEFIRLRRPEINAWFLERFKGIHRESEILKPSGIFWTLLGCWSTMVFFTNKRLVLAALGFLVFGDTAAALVGKKWGRHYWKRNPQKSKEGTLGFGLVSLAWSVFFLRWPVAVLGSAAGAFIELERWPWNDNFWIPILSALVLSVLNIFLGRHH